MNLQSLSAHSAYDGLFLNRASQGENEGLLRENSIKTRCL